MTKFMLQKFIQSALLLVVLFTTVQSYAQVSQAPDGIQFQALATDANGHPAAGRVIYVKDAIIAKTATGTIVYSETFKVTASSAGIFTIVLGKGTYASGVTSIANIDWANGPFFLNLKVAVEPTVPTSSWNVNNEYVDMGTSQFWSVPYALYAGNVKGLDTKLNISDTAAMLKPYFTAINLKANIESPTFTGTVKGITKAMVGLANADNTSDLDKPISTATQAALDLKANAADVTTSLALKANTADVNTALALKANEADVTTSLALKANAADVTTALDLKVDKVTGKALSTNDYTTAEKTKLASITGTNTGDQDLSALATNSALALKANTTDVNAALALKANATDVSTALDLKVDKVTGKELSTNDYTTAEKTKLASITGTNTGDQDLSALATNSALALKANTTDVNAALALKANATDVSTALDLKVDKVTGKELSTNDYTTAEKTKLAAITGTNTGDQINITGNAATATKLATPRNINGIAFDGSENITIAAAASTLSGIVQVANGGTGSNTKNFVDLNSDQTIAGVKTFNKDIVVNSVMIGKGGNTQADNIAIGNGARSGNINTGGNANIAIGSDAQKNNTGFYNVSLGNANLVNGSGDENTALGYTVMANNTSGMRNTGVGLFSFYQNTTGNYNTAIGHGSLGLNTTGSYNTALGTSADVATNNLTNATAIGYGASVDASNSIQLGNTSVSNVKTSGTITAGVVTYPNTHGANGQVLSSTGNGTLSWTTPSTTATSYSGVLPIENGGTSQTTLPGIKSILGLLSNNIAIGNEAGTPNQGVNANTIAIGGGAGRGNQGASSIAIGYVSGDQNQGANSISIGGNAAQAGQGSQAVAIGYAAGQNSQGANAVAIGTFAGQSSQAANSIAINATGTNTPLNPQNSGLFVDPIRSTTATTNLLFYNTTSKEITAATGNGSFVDLTTAQTIAGSKTFDSDITVNGVKIGRGNGNNDQNVAVGADALASGTGTRNTAVGYGAMRQYSGTSFDNNTSVGYFNMLGLTTGGANTSMGGETMFAVGSGANNTAIGNHTLMNATTSGNTVLGANAGNTITSGSLNTIIGFQANVGTNSLYNATAIGNGAVVTASDAIQLGNTSVSNVKTSGTLTADAVTYPKVHGTAGQVLSTTGSGTLAWTTIPAGPIFKQSRVNQNTTTGTADSEIEVGGMAFRYNKESQKIEVKRITNLESEWQAYITSRIESGVSQALQQPYIISTGGAWAQLSGSLTISGNYHSYEFEMTPYLRGQASDNHSFNIKVLLDGWGVVTLRVIYY